MVGTLRHSGRTADADMTGPETERRFRGAGGTPGGVGEFLFGLGMLVGAGYLLTDNITVSTGYWRIWGRDASGLSLIPLLLGVGFVFFDGKSIVGWLLTGAGCLIILAGVLMNLHFYFQPTSLFNTLLMLGLLASGIGLIARSLRPH
jgi:uncharacterized protein